jgi:hypothetical protein
MCNSTDPEMVALGVTMFINEIQETRHYRMVKDLIRNIHPSIGAPPRGRKGRNTRMTLAIMAQAKHFQNIQKSKKHAKE